MITKANETPAEREIRLTNILRRAHSRIGYMYLSPEKLYDMVRSSVRAALPGRQQAKNLSDAMEKAIKAAARVLGRRYDLLESIADIDDR